MAKAAPDRKAQALAGLAAGKTVRAVCAETGLSVGTVGGLRTTIAEQIEQLEQESPTGATTFGGMFAAHFQTQIAALDSYAKNTSSPEYIRTQNAGDVASLHSAIAGYTIRVLDIASRINAGIANPAPADE